jgi:hypothetical protein
MRFEKERPLRLNERLKVHRTLENNLRPIAPAECWFGGAKERTTMSSSGRAAVLALPSFKFGDCSVTADTQPQRSSTGVGRIAGTRASALSTFLSCGVAETGWRDRPCQASRRPALRAGSVFRCDHRCMGACRARRCSGARQPPTPVRNPGLLSARASYRARRPLLPVHLRGNSGGGAFAARNKISDASCAPWRQCRRNRRRQSFHGGSAAGQGSKVTPRFLGSPVPWIPHPFSRGSMSSLKVFKFTSRGLSGPIRRPQRSQIAKGDVGQEMAGDEWLVRGVRFGAV